MNYDIFREYNYFFDKVIFLRASSLKYIDSEIDLNFDFLIFPKLQLYREVIDDIALSLISLFQITF